VERGGKPRWIEKNALKELETLIQVD